MSEWVFERFPALRAELVEYEVPYIYILSESGRLWICFRL